MRKSDKKIENQIREVLTDVCEDTLKSYEGFLWVTHTVNYSSFPQSLKIICVFETSQDRANTYQTKTDQNGPKSIKIGPKFTKSYLNPSIHFRSFLDV